MATETPPAEWDVNDVSVSIGGIEVSDFVDLFYDSDPKTSFIPSVKGPVGYNHQNSEEPNWYVTVKSTCEQLADIRGMKADKTVMTVVMKFPDVTVNCYDALIHKINLTGAVEKESPGYKIEGYALKIEES